MNRPMAWLVAIGALAAATGAEWDFEESPTPIRWEVKLEHEEKGSEKLKLELTLEAKRTTVAEGEAAWEITIERVEGKRLVDGKWHTFDSRKEKGSPSAPVRWFAGLAGQKLDVKVAPTGELKSVAGALSGVPGPGDFLAEGANRDRLLGEALLGEIVVKLFRIPGGSGYACGVVCPLGNGVAGCHLAERTEVTRESGKKREWKSTLTSDGGSISAGGQTLKLKGGEAGTSKGSATYAPGHLVKLDEKLDYEMPTATRTVKFERRLEIEQK